MAVYTDKINQLNGAAQLAEIAKMAYGSGLLEGTRGGAGNIGVIGGRVIKFNTHASERKDLKVTEAMKESCNALRFTLASLARKAYAGKEDAARLRSVMQKLGLNAEGTHVAGPRTLLERKVVASVVKELAGKMKEDHVWDEAKKNAGELASTGVQTTFGEVRDAARKASGMSPVNVAKSESAPKSVDMSSRQRVGAEQICKRILLRGANAVAGTIPYGVNLFRSCMMQMRELGFLGVNNEFDDKQDVKIRSMFVAVAYSNGLSIERMKAFVDKKDEYLSVMGGLIETLDATPDARVGKANLNRFFKAFADKMEEEYAYRKDGKTSPDYKWMTSAFANDPLRLVGLNDSWTKSLTL